MHPSLLVALGAAVLATTLVVAAPTPANATADACAEIPGFGFTYQGVNLTVPRGSLCHQIVGDDKNITFESADYRPFYWFRFCNWRIDFEYKDAEGNLYRTDRGPIDNGCATLASRDVRANKTLAHYGTACAVLFVNGRERARQCHNICRSGLFNVCW